MPQNIGDQGGDHRRWGRRKRKAIDKETEWLAENVNRETIELVQGSRRQSAEEHEDVTRATQHSNRSQVTNETENTTQGQKKARMAQTKRQCRLKDEQRAAEDGTRTTIEAKGTNRERCESDAGLNSKQPYSEAIDIERTISV